MELAEVAAQAADRGTASTGGVDLVRLDMDRTNAAAGRPPGQAQRRAALDAIRCA